MTNDLISKNWSDAQWFNFICGLIKEPSTKALDLLKLQCYGFTGFRIPHVRATSMEVTVDVTLENSSKYKYKKVEYPWILNGASLAFLFDTNVLEVTDITIPEENPLQAHIHTEYDNQFGYVNIYDINEPGELEMEQDSVVFASIKFRLFNRYATTYGSTPLLCVLCQYPTNYNFQDVIKNTCQCLTYHVANYNNASNDLYYAMPTTNCSGEISWGLEPSGIPLPGRDQYKGTWHIPGIGLGGTSWGNGGGVMSGGGSVNYGGGSWTYTPGASSSLNGRPGSGLAAPDGSSLGPGTPPQPTPPGTQESGDFWFAKIDKNKGTSHGSDIFLQNQTPVNGNSIHVNLGHNDATKSIMLGDVEIPITSEATVRDKDGNLLDVNTLKSLPNGSKIRLPDGTTIHLYQDKDLVNATVHTDGINIPFNNGTVITLADKTVYVVPSNVPPVLPGGTTITLTDGSHTLPSLIRGQIEDIVDELSRKYFVDDTIYVWDFVTCVMNGAELKLHIEQVLCDDLFITDFVNHMLWHVPQSVDELSKVNDSFYIRDFILTNKYIAPVVDVIVDNTDNGVTVEDFVVVDKHKHKIVHILDTTIESLAIEDFATPVKYKHQVMLVRSNVNEYLTIEDFATPVKYKAPIPNIQSPSLGTDSLTVEDFIQHTLTHKQ